MPNTFAVIDAGSNAIRIQIASVDQPGFYRIIEQERRPVRLGHKVFETGRLDKRSRAEALDALKKFRATADRAQCTAVRAVATSALREASDRGAFVREAAELGVQLEILPERDEARLISLGILSGIRFDLPLGLFMDIGGGSVEIALGNRTKLPTLLSVPLGAVRLTERYLKEDPPSEDEISRLQRQARRLLSPIAKRVTRHSISMAFGSGGTMTTIADADSRVTGEVPKESLYVIRRDRLNTLFDLLRSQPLERADAILGDPKRGEILVAGAAVLLTMMNLFKLDYLFVTRRGLRDGLMVDLLKRSYPKYDGAWREQTDRTESLEEIGEKYNYDKTHSQHVSRLALRLFEETSKLHKLPDRFMKLLHASAMLHDIGTFLGYRKHHKHSYYLIKSSLAGMYDEADLDIIAATARYHRKAHPDEKHVEYGGLSNAQQDAVRKLGAILRIADALDYDHQSKVKDLSCTLKPNKRLTIHVSGRGDVSREIDYAVEKAEFMTEIYNIDVVID